MPVHNFFASPSLELVGWSLVHFVWQGAVLALLLAAALRLLRRSSAQARYVTGCAALALMAACPPATIAWLAQHAQINRSVTSPRSAHEIALGTATQPQPAEPPSTPSPPSAAGGRAGVGGPTVAVLSPPSSPPSQSKGALLPSLLAQAIAVLQPRLPWLVGLWLAGVALLSMRLALGWLRIEHLRRRSRQPAGASWQAALSRMSARLGVTRAVRLVDSALVDVPTVIGWLRPVILLPATAVTGLSAAQVEALLAHELAHIRRHDYLVNLLQTALETLLFYHPAVWWVSSRIRQEREHCCDDAAIAACGDRAAYARALAVMEELRARPPALVAAASGGSLLERIRRIAGKAETQRSPSNLLLPVVLGCMLTGLVCAAHFSLSDEKPTDQPATLPLPKRNDALPEIVGTVVTPDEKPAAGIEVVAYHGTRVERRFVTDARGQLRIPGEWWRMPHDSVDNRTLVAIDGSNRIGWHEVASYETRARGGRWPGELPPPEPFRITLLPCERHISGRVLDSSHMPLRGARVRVGSLKHAANGIGNIYDDYTADGMHWPFAEVFTDVNGRFEFAAPSRTRVVANVFHADWVTHALEIGEADSLPDAVLTPGGKIVGRVVRESSSKPVPGVRVYAYGITLEGKRGGFGNGYTDADGKFVIGGLLDDAYNVMLGEVENARWLVAPVHEPVQVHVGETASANFSLQLGRRVVGRVVESDTERPSADARVYARVSLRPNETSIVAIRGATTDTAGRFELFVPPGICTLRVDADYRTESRDGQRTFEINADADPPEILLTLGKLERREAGAEEIRAVDAPQGLLRVPVELRSADKAPIGNVGLRCFHVGDDTSYQSASAAGRSFQVATAAGDVGRTHFYIIDVPGYAPARTPDFVIQKDMQPVVVDLKPAVYVPLRGVVTDREGKPLQGARVRVVRWFFNNECVAPWGVEAVTGVDGTYELRHLRVGEAVEFQVERQGYTAQKTTRIELTGPQTIPVLDWRLNRDAAASQGRRAGEDPKVIGPPQPFPDSRAWHILSQPDGIDLLFGMPQRLDKAAEPARRGGRAWTGVDGGGSVDLNIEVEGEAAGEILVGFFNDARWWLAEPVQVRSFEKPGRYSIDRLPAGTYHLGAMIGSAVTPIALGVDRDWPRGVTVRAGRTTAAELRISKKFQDNISGVGFDIRNGTAGKPRVSDAAKMHTVRIVDQQDRPVPFARVTVVEWQRDNPEQVNDYHEVGGDVDGLAYFDQYPGPFSLMHQRFDFDPASLASRYFLTRRTTRYDSSQPKIELVAADFPGGSGTIRGRVHDQYGKPLDQYFLSLTRTIGEQLSNDFATFYSVRLPVTNADGRFEVRGLPPGTYTAGVRHFDYPTHVSTFDGPKVTLPDQPGAVVDADFEVEAKELRYGRIVSSDGQPVSRGGYKAQFTPAAGSPAGGDYFSLGTDPGGAFRVAVSAAERKLLERNSGGKIEVFAKDGKGQRIATTTVRFDQLSTDRQQPASVVLKRQSQRELTIIMVEQLGGHVGFDKDDPNQIMSVDLSSSKVADDDLKVLEGLTTLRAVNLNFTRIGDAGLAHLKDLRKLESLGLERCGNVTDAGLAHVKGLVNLTDLSLPQTKVTDAGMEYVKNMPKLRWLDLTGCEITDKGAALLHGHKDLRVLFFSRRGDNDLRPPLVSVEAVQALRKAIPSCDIQSEPPGDRKAAEAEMRRRTERGQREEQARIERISELVRQGFAVENIEQAVAALQQLPATVGKLADGLSEYVHDRRPRPDGPSQIADLDKYQAGSKIVFVDLSNYPVDDRFLAHLRFLTDLALLDLQKTAITDAGLAPLATLDSLKVLHLHGTAVGDAGLAHLSRLTKLEELGLLDTRVTDAGLIHLKPLTNLVTLMLGGTGVSDAGLEQLAGLTKLESLDLSGTQVSDAGLTHLKGLTKLRNLNLRATRVTEAGVAELQKSLPEATIVFRGPRE